MASSDESRPYLATATGVDVVPGRSPAQLTTALEPRYAMWPQRVVAAVLDNAILAGVTWLALGAGFPQPTLTPGTVSAASQGWANGPLILIPIGALAVLLLLQAVTGWTPGKLVVGIRVLRERSAVPAGLWTTLVRWFLHLLDAILLIGYLRPLWHPKRQTFADGIAHTVVVQQVPRLPRRQGAVVYAAALVTCVLGLGYSFPISGYSSSAPGSFVSCELPNRGPRLTTGTIALSGSAQVATDRRLWTVRETRTVRPGATVSWSSDPSVRDADYRIELDARPASAEGTPVVSHSWDIGTGGAGESSGDPSYSHTRSVSPDGDVHVADVEFSDPDGDRADELRGLGTNVWMNVRLVADGEVVAGCGGTADYDAVDAGS